MFKILIYTLMFYLFDTHCLSADMFNIEITYKKYRAEKEYSKGNIKKSIKILQKIEKKDYYILYNLGNLFYILERYHIALKYYKKALLSNRIKAKILHNIGNVYFKQEKFKIASRSYSDSLKMYKNYDTRFNYNLTKMILDKISKNKIFNKNIGLNNNKKASLKKKIANSIQSKIATNSLKNRGVKKLLSKLKSRRPIIKHNQTSTKESNLYANPW